MRDFTHLILDLEIKKKPQYSRNWLHHTWSDASAHKSFLANAGLASKLTHTRLGVASDFEELNIEAMKSSQPLISGANFVNQNKVSFDIHDTININFLRKERLYTKLKYSRSPAYDIVSGGAAAILAGFIGFLISEKFGFELVDSGDFYYLFMYIVFASFSMRPLLIATSAKDSLASVFSLKPLANFIIVITSLFFKTVKSLFRV